MRGNRLPPGRIMADVAGLALDCIERDLLGHPAVGGVTLFARNFESRRQLRSLTAELRSLREPQLLIAVDHEGGRVQRFRTGYTRIPPMAALGAIQATNPNAARALARAEGSIFAAELVEDGVDFSYAPVLDLDFGRSGVIGDRSFGGDPEKVAELASALMEGMNEAGMAAVGKHFPGHGWPEADSHVAVPVDERPLEAISAADLVPYRRLIAGGLAAVMPAHVVFPRVDPLPAGFSARWLKDILRGELGFGGMIFSDDLTMEGATAVGGIVERARAALHAGCDMVLVCNRPDLTGELAQAWEAGPVDAGRAARLRCRRPGTPAVSRAAYTEAVAVHRKAFDAEGRARAQR